MSPSSSVASGRRKGVERGSAGAGHGTRLLAAVSATAALVLPLIISYDGEDTFRLPKELAMRGLAIAAATALLWILLTPDWRSWLTTRVLRSPPALIGVAIIGWSVLTTLTSTNRLVSMRSLEWIFSLAVLMAATLLIAGTRKTTLAALVLVPAAINVLFYLLQESGLWNPFTFPRGLEEHLTRTALIGNPNDVGSYFVAPALCACAMALGIRKMRGLWLSTAALLILATFATHTITAIGALIAGIAVMALLRSPRNAVAILLLCVGLVAAASLAYPPLAARRQQLVSAWSTRDYDALGAFRTTAFLAAAHMARDHPITGVGPGAFGWQYYDYKLAIERASLSRALSPARRYNFDAAHSDHLQVLAEVGLPGYLLMVALLVSIGGMSFTTKDDEDPRDQMVKWLALPLAVSFFILAIAQFPLELVAPSHAFLYESALLVAWRYR